MDVRELTFRGENETRLYACGKCGHCYSPLIYGGRSDVVHQAARDAAERCCVPPTCSVCGIEVQRPWTMCAKHREQAKLRRAVPIPAKDWHDPVFSDEVSGDWGEGYSSDIDALLECAADENVWNAMDENKCVPAFIPPVYSWPCKSDPLRIDPHSVLEHAVEDHHEDACDQIVDYADFVTFVEAWNAKQICKSWYPDYSRVVVLDEARFAKLLEDG